MSRARSFDPIWEKKYSSGHEQRAPWDEAVSFVFRNAPKHRARNEVRILEVGCGTASNLWFFSLEGFDVTGIDASGSAISKAKARFKKDKLKGDLRVGDFTQLPYPDSSFDLVVDRASLTTCGTTSMTKAIQEIYRVLKRDGRFLFTPYSDCDSSYQHGQRGDDDLTIAIKGGYLANVGQIRFVSHSEITTLLPLPAWRLQSLEKIETVDMLSAQGLTLGHWRVVAVKQ